MSGIVGATSAGENLSGKERNVHLQCACIFLSTWQTEKFYLANGEMQQKAKASCIAIHTMCPSLAGSELENKTERMNFVL